MGRSHSLALLLGIGLTQGCATPGERLHADGEGRAPAADGCGPTHASVAPALSGRYCVGVTRRVLRDPARSDPFALGEVRAREVSVTLRYPIASGSRAAPAPYGDRETWGVLFGKALPSGAFSQALLDESVADDRFPLLVYSPGFDQGLADTNTFMIEELVSHGYVVAAVDHPFVSYAVRRDDGSIVRFGDGREALAMPDDIAATDAAVYAFPVVIDDLEFVLDRILELARNDPAWRGRIDEHHIGAFGHSYGGAAAAELVRSDPRVRAGIDYDGQFHSDVLAHGIGGPLLLIAVGGRITADPPPNDNYGYRIGLGSATPGYYAELRGAVHGMFQADLGVLIKRQLGKNDPVWSGEIDADRNLELCSAYNLAFFDATLKGASTAALEEIANAYDFVRFGEL